MSRILLEGVTKVFSGDVVAVDDIDLTIESGEFMVLVGPSGCGKSTLLRMIAGLEVVANGLDPRPDGWRVLWRDEAQCTECGEPCKRGALSGDDVVYVGDGYSDRCAALSASRVFARDGLAAHLDRLGIAYEPFGDLRDVARTLAT